MYEVYGHTYNDIANCAYQEHCVTKGMVLDGRCRLDTSFSAKLIQQVPGTGVIATRSLFESEAQHRVMSFTKRRQLLIPRDFGVVQKPAPRREIRTALRSYLPRNCIVTRGDDMY
jgi:hypothetical protein